MKLICWLFGHAWTQKMSGALCSRCRTFEHGKWVGK